jgi:hypothetical protein|tara:strand:+ start:216 stop:326 length:111 start_codon:yes stop_codon:yes gene_type:complete
MKLDMKKLILKRKELDKTHKQRKARGKVRLKKLLKK